MYREHAKKLIQTGSGIAADDAVGIENEERLRFYLPPDGPDKSTSSEAQNLWGECAAIFSTGLRPRY
jgi:hypothetical protein